MWGGMENVYNMVFDKKTECRIAVGPLVRQCNGCALGRVGVVDRMMSLERDSCPDTQNLRTCYLSWQKVLCRCG